MVNSYRYCDICGEEIKTHDTYCKLNITTTTPRAWMRRDELEYDVREICATCIKQIYNFVELLKIDGETKIKNKPIRLWFGTNGCQLNPDGTIQNIMKG